MTFVCYERLSPPRAPTIALWSINYLCARVARVCVFGDDLISARSHRFFGDTSSIPPPPPPID